jgi:hypothetical protein
VDEFLRTTTVIASRIGVNLVENWFEELKRRVPTN